jgi:cytochrome P450
MSPETASPGRSAPRFVGRWPGPTGHWLTGCMRSIQNDPLNFYRQTWATYGDYVEIRILPGAYFYFLCDPSAVEHVLSKYHKNYRKPDVLNKPVRMLTGNGMFVNEGESWLRQRRLSQPAFLRKHIASFSPQIVAAVEQLAEEWEREQEGRRLDVVPEMMRLSLRIASTAMFSTDISADADVIGSAFDYVSRRMNGRITFPLAVPMTQNREFRRCKALLDRVVLELIESRRREPTGQDVLALLLAAQDEESGTRMTDQQLKDEVITFLTAGHETTAAALSWAWYLLAQHPDAQEALHDEALARLHGRTPTADDLPHLPFATAVFEETMRLYPPAWGLPRETIDDDEINGYPLRKKTIVTLSQWVTHRHPEYWSEPDCFQPERFLPGQTDVRPKFAYFPFGGGPRACIGNHFAMLEGPLVLAALAQRFQFTLVPEHAVIPDATFTLRPKTGVKVVLRKRR